MDKTPIPPIPSLSDKIVPLLEDLYYPSESDEPVQFFSLPWTRQEEITAGKFGELLDLDSGENVTEEEPEQFWAPVTVDREWYETEERERTVRFGELRRILEETLEHIHYYEVGEMEVGLYLIGRADKNIMGIKTTAIRT
ncbi:nuclease A inhibitor family protein [Persicitalea sp.]|uniref:nuclease A inhibitor family protein n=1 Tax=Persicitalea sp. TaxID=3100273 RepID=UPI003593F3C5